MTKKTNKTSVKTSVKKDLKKDSIFEFKHSNGDVFTYEDATHEYKLNGIELPGTTTPLKLVNELSWDENGKMTDKSQIIQAWAIKMVTNEILENTKEDKQYTSKEIESITLEAKKAPNKRFTGAGISGTEIHAEIEKLIKLAISSGNGFLDNIPHVDISEQSNNFFKWALSNEVKFLFSEEPIYSKEWMSCGTVDFICEIDGKILVGDIKTNGDKRRYSGKMIKGKWIEDKSKPQSDIHIPALWQCGCYGKMCTESDARKLVDKIDGVVIVNIKKSGEFDEKLDVRFDYNIESLIRAFDLVIKLYKEFRNKYV
jgi:hypothetical protein